MKRPAPWLVALLFVTTACASAGTPAREVRPAGPAQPTPTSAAAALGSPTPATASAVVAEPTPLPRRLARVAYPAASLSAMSYMYAEDHGLYARYGVEVESTGMTPAPALAALMNGELQYLYYGSTLLLAPARGMPVRPFLQGSRGPSLMLFARPEITSFADLRGKAISVLSAAGLSREVTELVLEKHGVSPREVDLLAAGSAAGQMEQLRQGIAAAAPISPPWPLVASREGYRLLANIGQEIVYPFGVMATSTARLQSERAEVKAVIRATLEANRLIREDREGTIAWIARRFDVAPDVAAESYDLVIDTQNDTGEILPEGVANYFRSQQEQPELRDVRYEDVVEVEVLREVWREMGLTGAPSGGAARG